MRIESRLVLLLVLISSGLPAGCASAIRFERVEHFPAGIQIDTFASAVENRLSPTPVSQTFETRYEDAWQAAIEVARRFERRLDKAELLFDGETGRIQITDEQQMPEDAGPGQNTGASGNLRRPSGSKLSGWKDEFLIQVNAISEARTVVTLSRAVLGIPRFRYCFYVAAMCERGTYEPEVSNGQIENWVLTQITDELVRRLKA